MVIKRYTIGVTFVLIILLSMVYIALATAPVITIIKPQDNGRINSTSFHFVANIASSVENLNYVGFTVTNDTWSDNLVNDTVNQTTTGMEFTYDLPSTIADGLYTLNVTARNNLSEANFVIHNFTVDNMPPQSVNITNVTSGQTYINWTWTDPDDSDFSYVKVYLNTSSGSNLYTGNVPNGTRYFNSSLAGILSSNTTYRLSTQTVDTTGNINNTPVISETTTLPNTPTGSNVIIDLSNGVKITFFNVTKEGNTSKVPYTVTDNGSKFNIAGNAYDITTNALYEGNITIEMSFTSSNPSSVKLYHYNNSAWEDITTGRDIGINKVWGNVTSLSPIVPGDTTGPKILSHTPDSPKTTTVGTSVNFTVSFDQIVNVTWLRNGSQISSAGNNSVTSSYYLNNDQSIGTWNITAVGNNENGTVSYSWIWTVQPKTYFQGNRVWDSSRPDLFSKTYTWNPMSFSGFYYNIDKDVGNESITITLNSYTDRTISKGNIIYSTTPEEVGFGYSNFGSYQVIGFMADKYFAGYIANTTITNARPSTTFAGKSALAQGQLHKVLIDDDTQRTVSVGGTLTLQEGYVLKATDIDTTARTMLITLLKDGSEVDTTPLSAGETYVYTKRVGAVQDLPIIMVRFDNVFSGREVQAAFLKGLFQISESPTILNTGTQFGSMEVTGVGGNGIQMDNKNSISLTEGSTQDLMGDMKIVVADNSSVLRFALSVEKTGNFEVRSSVYRNTDPTPITEWNPYNFGMNIGKTSIGFYYNLDDGIGNESLKINPTSSLNVGGRTISDQGLVYTTTPQDVNFGYTNFGSYQAIGFMADKYFAGYTDGTTVNAKPSTTFSDKSALAQGQLHKVLIDDDTQRTVSVGGTLTLQEGYVLKATDIDTTARIMLITLLKDGSEVDTTPLSAGETYVYTKKIGAVRDLPIIMVRFDNVFSGREVQAAFLKGVFQISENPTVLKTGDHFGKMEVTGVSKDAIEMKNDGSLSLNQNSEDTLMGDIKLKVADSSDHLRFYFAVDVTPEMVANQLVIDAPSKITAGDVAIVKITAGGAAVNGASVVLDSTDMGQTDSTGAVNYTLPKTLKGMYNITASKLGYQSATRSIEILQYVEYRLSMDAPAKANQFETIPIKITYNGTAVAGATVKYDNTTIGTTDSNGVLNYKLDTSGTHTLTASKSGYITVAREIEVRAPYSEYRALDINITPNSTFTNREVMIRSNITNAGTKGDTLPVELKVNNSVVDNRTVTLSPGETQEINFTLKEAKPGNYTVEILGQKGILEVKEAPLNYLLIGGIATGMGAIIIYVLTAKGKITLGEMKSKLNVDAIKSLLSKSGKKGL